MFKLTLCLLLAVSAASACQMMAAPGTTVTTTTTTVSTVSGGSEGSGAIEGMSESDKTIIRRTWATAKKSGKVTPKILYNFLTAHPEYQKKFALFANVPKDQLMKNGDFLAQAFTIMTGFNVIVESLGSNELVAYEASHLGKTHFERGVSVAMFEQFSRSVLDALREEAHLDDEEIHAWENGLSALVAAIGKSLKKAEDVPHTVTGLTPNQIEDVQRTWEKVRSDREGIVSSIFIKLFKTKASLQQKFQSFSDVSVNDLPSNSEFKAQVALVANRLDSMIHNLNTPLKLGGELRYMAFSHKPRGVLRQEFTEFGVLLMDHLAAKGISGDDMDSWKSVSRAIVEQIAKVQGL